MYLFEEERLLNKKSRTYWELVLISGIVIILDQITKYIVRTNLQLRETWMPWEWLEPYARIIHWKNTGVAFGLFQGRGWLFTIIGLAVVVVIILLYRRTIDHKRFWRVALAFQLGGALGNLIDRINPQVGYVVDFIWIGNFPVFNIADIAIVCGAAILIIGMWITEDKTEESVAAQTAEPGLIPGEKEAEEAENAAGQKENTAEDGADDALPELPGHS